MGEEGVTTVTRSVGDRAGREQIVATTVRVDLADPTITATPDRGPDLEGWYTSPVTMTFTCSDPPPGSGILDCPAPVSVTDDGDQTVTGRARDHADRHSAEATARLRVDTQPPDATITRRNLKPDLSGGRLHGSAIDAGSGIRNVIITSTRISRPPLTVVADVSCSEATRRVCTWSAQAPPAESRETLVTAIDRVGREDPTPDKLG